MVGCLMHGTRRQFVQGPGFGSLGLSLTDLAAAPAREPSGRARACILLWLFGGPSHIDIWDMKPDAPADYRGEFQPIHTSVPGIVLCEHLPRTAGLAQHLALVRSVTMSGRVIGNGDHHVDTYYMLTGHRPDQTFFVEGINRRPRADDWPFVGSAGAHLRQRERDALLGHDLPSIRHQQRTGTAQRDGRPLPLLEEAHALPLF